MIKDYFFNQMTLDFLRVFARLWIQLVFVCNKNKTKQNDKIL